MGVLVLLFVIALALTIFPLWSAGMRGIFGRLESPKRPPFPVRHGHWHLPRHGA